MLSLNKELSIKIKNNKEDWSKEIKEYHYQMEKGLKDKYNDKQDQHFLEDIRYHLNYLAEAISLNSLSLFKNYINWTKVFFENTDISVEGLKSNLKYTKEVLEKKLDKEEVKLINKYIDNGLEIIAKDSIEPKTHLREENPQYSLATEYFEYLQDCDRKKASELILNAVEDGVEIKDIYLNVFQPVQREIGRLWQLNKVSVAKEHYSTSVTQLIMSQLYSYILSPEKNSYKAITTCVGDELHELGIRMIADLLEMDGWDTVHLGANMPAQSIVEEIIEEDGDLLAISVTMTSNLSKATHLIEEVRKNPESKNIKIMVGGYPFNINEELWKEVGADGYAPDLNKASAVANKLVKKGGSIN